MVATIGRYSIAADLFDAADAWDEDFVRRAHVPGSYEYNAMEFAGHCHHGSPESSCEFCNPKPAPAPVADTVSDADIVMKIAARIGRKFEVRDITHSGPEGQWLYDTAAEWLDTQTGADFEWLAELARKHVKGGGLTDGQAKGVLNCMVAALRRDQSAPAPVQDAGWGNPVANAVMARAATVNATNAERKAEAEADAAYREHLASLVSQGYYTLVRDDGTHRTLKVGKWTTDRSSGGRIRWMSYLAGPSNTEDYQWFAVQTDAGELRRTRNATDSLMAEADALLLGTDEARKAARVAYAQASTRCSRCNRELTHPESISDGVGPECAGKI